MPDTRLELVSMMQFVDSDHAGEKMTYRSHSVIPIYFNRATIIWYSKNQNTIKSSSFVSEVVDLRAGLDITKGLRYNFRIIGIPINGPMSVFLIKSWWLPVLLFQIQSLARMI